MGAGVDAHINKKEKEKKRRFSSQEHMLLINKMTFKHILKH
jgi:hypothetical protein